MANTKTGSRKRATNANASPAGDIDLPRASPIERVAPAGGAMLGIAKMPIPSRPLRPSRAEDLPPPRGERETIAAAVLAVFNAEKRIGDRFIDFHHSALDAELPGFGGWKDRRKLELAEAAVFEVRRVSNQARRAMDPQHLGEAIDPKVAIQEQAAAPYGMLMPFEWILALSPAVEQAVAAMPPADRQDLAVVAALIAEAAVTSDRPPFHGLNETQWAALSALSRLAEDDRIGPKHLGRILNCCASTADKTLRRLRNLDLVDRPTAGKAGARLTAKGRELIAGNASAS